MTDPEGPGWYRRWPRWWHHTAGFLSLCTWGASWVQADVWITSPSVSSQSIWRKQTRETPLKRSGFSGCYSEKAHNTYSETSWSHSYRALRLFDRSTKACQRRSVCDGKTCGFMLTEWKRLQFRTWGVSSPSLQRGIVDSSCQILCRSLGGCMPACQSHNAGGLVAWLEHIDT